MIAIVGRTALIAALLAAPWCFGSVTPQSQWLLGLTLTGLLLLQLVESVWCTPERSWYLPTAIIAPVGLLVLAAIQLLPREEPLMLGMNHAVLPELLSAFAENSQATGTVYPAATRTQASLLYFGLAAFLLSVRWFSSTPAILWLWGAVTINGAVLGFFGIVQKMTWNGLLFWSVPLRAGGTPFASFVNRNNAAGYLNLCMAAALACLIAHFGGRHGLAAPAGHLRSIRTGWVGRLRHRLAGITGLELLLAGCATITAAAVLFSLSRGGIVAMGVGFGVILMWQRRSTKLAGLIVAVALAAAVVGTLSFVGGWDAIGNRMSSLTAPLVAAEGRLHHWRDTFGAVVDFPLTGSGFGGYRYANLPYQIHEGNAWYVNADNHPYEILVETGVIGLTFYLAGFCLLGVATLFLCRQLEAENRAAGILGLFAIATQLVQAVTDFGLAIPSNALTFAVLGGAICGRACQTAEFYRRHVPLGLALTRLEARWGQATLSLVLVFASAAFGVELFTATRAATARSRFVDVDPGDPLQTNDIEIEVPIEQAIQALRLRPDDAELHRAVALGWIDLYRLSAARELSSAADLPQQLRGYQLWQATSVRVLTARIADLSREADWPQVDYLKRLPMVRENLAPAREHLMEASRHSPLARDVSRYLADLSFLGGENSQTLALENSLRRAIFIVPSSPDHLLSIGIAAEKAGLMGIADLAYSRCLTVSDKHIMPVWTVISQNRSLEELLESAIPDRLEVLVTLAEEISQEVDRNTLVNRVERLLNDAKEAGHDGSTEYLRARLAELKGQRDEAIHHYRLALDTDTWNVEARVRFAQLLLSEKRHEEADAELTVLQGLVPSNSDVKRLRDELWRSRSGVE